MCNNPTYKSATAAAVATYWTSFGRVAFYMLLAYLSFLVQCQQNNRKRNRRERKNLFEEK
jgi:hypothetical protein